MRVEIAETARKEEVLGALRLILIDFDEQFEQCAAEPAKIALKVDDCPISA